jgi:micrococcal nuclease
VNRLNKTLSALLIALIYIAIQTFTRGRPLTLPTPLASPSPISQNSSITLSVVERVIDGDTIEITGGIKVRYIGINAPESVAPGKPVACFGEESSDRNKKLVLGKEVRLEKDVSETDKYGRLLRYVYVGDQMINDELVREGYAQVSTYPPDVKYQEMFKQSEVFARENNLGLWGKCSDN